MPLGSHHGVLFSWVVFGCLLAGTEGQVAEPLTHYGFDESSYSPAAQEGLQEIYSGRGFHNGVPLRAAMARVTTPAAETAAPPSRDASGFMPSPKARKIGAGPGLPLGASMFTRNSVMLVNGNCFGCHAGIVRGQVVAGLGNTRTDPAGEYAGLQQLLAAADQRTSSLKTDAERKEFTEFIDHSRVAVVPFRHAKSRGDNYGPYAVWRLGARLADPEKTGMLVSATTTPFENLIDAMELPTVDPMPWWLMKYKKKDYWYGDGGIDDASHFAFNFTTAHPEINESRADHVATVAKMLAFARETQSPPYPGSLDPKLVAAGAELFHGRVQPTNRDGFVACKTCHGTYTRKATATDLTRPGGWSVTYDHSSTLRNVKTDPAYNETLRKLQPIADHINKLKTYFEAKNAPELAPYVTTPAKDGYVAPPLVGVWATGPYFHNGSVPTIEAVLSSSERPEIWSRDCSDFDAYDLERVGQVHQVVTSSDFEQRASAAAADGPNSAAARSLRSIYDTRGFGRSNRGHTFGDNLQASERKAIIEFLKSLSGPDM